MTAPTIDAPPLIALDERPQLAEHTVRRDQFAAKLSATEAEGKSLRHERAAMLAADGEDAERLRELDAAIAANAAAAQGWLDACEATDSRIAEVTERIRLYDVAAQGRSLADKLTARDEALAAGVAAARSAEQKLAALDAELLTIAAALQNTSREIARLGGTPVNLSEIATPAHTGELRACISALRDYLRATDEDDATGE